MSTVLGLIAVGGAAGALTRYGILLLLPEQSGVWPLATFLANLAGCALMGVFLGFVAGRDRTPQRLAPLIATGFLGGLTTFSTYAADAVLLVDADALMLAAAYLAATVVFGWLLLRLSWEAAYRIFDGPGPAPQFTPAELGD